MAAEAEVGAEAEAEVEAGAEVEVEVVPTLADIHQKIPLKIPPTRLLTNLFDVESEQRQRQWRRFLRYFLPGREGVECLPEPVAEEVVCRPVSLNEHVLDQNPIVAELARPVRSPSVRHLTDEH